ncbi:DUF1161 domain-containing protein [Usitatibacter palustris]|uniref:DUF1161 domain-containing protein n=1 Tax=Usitatibacter palustris TaxID=2732487 RepID=A0A6M4H6S8_9PROT|nr:DUF1161 domain-containing protein [Usitatibacter palustris]QJR15331.1 hypothetical protein DSM104440_02150 [Usitatibacter palustris]
MKKIVLAMVLALVAMPVAARKTCDDLKAEIEAKMTKKGVKNPTLEAVANADVKDGKVVGSCDGGTKKLVYTRGK